MKLQRLAKMQPAELAFRLRQQVSRLFSSCRMTAYAPSTCRPKMIASRRRILTSFALRSLILGAGAGSVAIIAGIAAGWAVMTRVMDAEFTVAWGSALAVVLGGIGVTLLAGLAFAWRPLAARQDRDLRARE